MRTSGADAKPYLRHLCDVYLNKAAVSRVGLIFFPVAVCCVGYDAPTTAKSPRFQLHFSTSALFVRGSVELLERT